METETDGKFDCCCSHQSGLTVDILSTFCGGLVAGLV